MTRIIAGAARGRRLRVPPAGTRPTADRVREAVFSALEHRLGGWSAATVLDLFAGSGAMGLEAASRGASRVLLVERDRQALKVLRANVALVAPAGGVEVLGADAWRLPPRDQTAPTLPRASLVVLDPPYADSDGRLAGLLAALDRDGWLADDAWAVVERGVRGDGFIWPAGWESGMDRRYAETSVHLGRLVASP